MFFYLPTEPTMMASTRSTPDSSDESEPPTATIPVITLSPYSPLKRRRIEPSDGFVTVHTIEDSSSENDDDTRRSSKHPTTTTSSSQMNRSFTARPEDSSFIESESDETTQKRVCERNVKSLPSSTTDSVPVIIFYNQHDLPVFSPDGSHVRELGMIYECNGSRFFQTSMDIGGVLLCLEDLETLDVYGNVSMPQQFQGSAMVAVRIRDSQKEDVFDFLSTDGNGGWESKRSGPLRAFKDGEERWYTRRYYTHTSTKIKKVIANLVNEESSQELAGQCAVVRYYWSNTKGKPVTPEMFPVAKERRPPSVFRKLKAAASEPTRGRSLGPSNAFHKVMDSISAEDMLLNSYCTPKDRRQATTAKQAAKKELFGKDGLSFLLNLENVTYTNISTAKGTEIVFFIATTYQKNLFRAVGLPLYQGKVIVDSTYNLGGRFVTVTVLEHPLLKKKDGGPALVIGPVFVTPVVTKEAYRQFAVFLRNCLKLEDMTGQSGWKLLQVTDDEAALHGAFKEEFPRCEQALCSVHVSRNLKEKLSKLKNPLSEERINSILRTIMGRYDAENQLFHAGLIDAESREDFALQYENLKTQWESQEFAKWFEKNYIEKFKSKLILAARKEMGFGVDLTTTNYVEAVNSTLKRVTGGIQDYRVVVKNIVRLVEDQLNDLALALKDEGEYRLVDENRRLVVPRARITDQKLILKNQAEMFFGDPGKTVLTKAFSALQENAAQRKGVPMDRAGTRTLKNAGVFPEFLDSGLDVSYSSMWDKAEAIFLNKNRQILRGEMDEDQQVDMFTRLVVSCDKKKKDIHYVVEIERYSGSPKCTCDFFRHSNLNLCKHCIAVAAVGGLISVVVEWCKSAPRSAAKALFQTKVSGRKPYQRVRQRGDGGSTKRSQLERVDFAASCSTVPALESRKQHRTPKATLLSSTSSNEQNAATAAAAEKRLVLCAAGTPLKAVASTSEKSLEYSRQIGHHSTGGTFSSGGSGGSCATGSSDASGRTLFYAAGIPHEVSVHNSLQPWRDSKHPWYVTKEIITNRSVLCAGCKAHLAIDMADLNMVLHHAESDFAQKDPRSPSSRIVLPEKTRRYHMKVGCVERRHGTFDPRTTGLVVIDKKWMDVATVNEYELVKRFLQRQIM